MTLRTLLFVPGDSERKLARGLASGADALILDLEDAAAPARKPLAQGMVAEALAARTGDCAPELWVRINLLDAGGLDDLAAVVRAAPAHAGTREPAAAGHAGWDGTSRGATAKRPGQATATPVDGRRPEVLRSPPHEAAKAI